MFPINRFHFLITTALLFLAISSANAQVVLYDWRVKGDAPKSYPTITRRQAVTIRIENVNDILFTYRMRVTQRRFDSSDFDAIARLVIRSTPAPSPDAFASECNTLNRALESVLKAAKDAITEEVKLPIGYAKQTSRPSVPLQDSLDAWRSHQPAIESVITAHDEVIRRCAGTPHETEYRRFITAVNGIREKVNRPHFIDESHTLDPGSHVSVTVDELYEGAVVSTATFTFDTQDVLTLSAGAMFSRIQDRTYEARKDPTSTLNTLTVEGNSQATPSLVALLNYSLGAAHLDWERAGFALSAGPVFRVGGQSDASSFGFFAGISGHLYRRIFITPGFHFGQFADFPVGFANGSSVPANFGELTPVKRWTTRFGLAITFKTKTFDAFGSEDKKIGGDEAGGATKPKEKEPENGENASNSRMMDAATALRYVTSRTTRSNQEITDRVPAGETETRVSDASPTVERPVSSAPMPTVYVSASAEPMIQVLSINARSLALASDERVIIETSARVSDYSIYFRAGRFYLVLPRTKLSAFQDGLEGHIFSDAVVEKRGSDLVLSFVLNAGATAKVVERTTGLDLVFLAKAPTQ